ncbi:MAG: UDP-N-acetylglucosamine--N-acetylmuramyl-(pentapeptide) pyrophosphoryl-undecaprenol N-acetylglucosamine transferase, partial [Parvibaculales bacterium]
EKPRAILQILRGVSQAIGILRKERPDFVVGFGGYPSFAPLIAARLLNIPYGVHEQNAVFGRVNRLLAGKAEWVALAKDNPRFLLKKDKSRAVHISNPLREEVLKLRAKIYAPPSQRGKIRLVVFGGSQGAEIFSRIIPASIALLPAALRKRLHIIQQVRHEDLTHVKKAYAKMNIQAELQIFFKEMPKHMSSASLIIARAGASTVSEIAVLGRPALLIPFDKSLDGDQYENAAFLAKQNAAWLIAEKDFSVTALQKFLEETLTAPEKLKKIAKNAHSKGEGKGAKMLAELVQLTITKNASHAIKTIRAVNKKRKK